MQENGSFPELAPDNVHNTQLQKYSVPFTSNWSQVIKLCAGNLECNWGPLQRPSLDFTWISIFVFDATALFAAAKKLGKKSTRWTSDCSKYPESIVHLWRGIRFQEKARTRPARDEWRLKDNDYWNWRESNRVWFWFKKVVLLEK